MRPTTNGKGIAIAVFVVALAIAYALKLHYSTATADQLRWILAPTAGAVEILCGRSFEFEPSTGYLCRDALFLIVPSCAGVNFLITCFLMLCGHSVLQARSAGSKIAALPASAALAYITTIIVNSLRITIAIETRDAKWSSRWLDAEQLHRIEGIVIYFGALLAIFSFSQTSVSGPFRWKLAPLLVYYAAAIGVPLANGAFRHAGFAEHTAFVVLIPLLMWGSFSLIIAPMIALRIRKANTGGQLKDGTASL